MVGLYVSTLYGKPLFRKSKLHVGCYQLSQLYKYPVDGNAGSPTYLAAPSNLMWW